MPMSDVDDFSSTAVTVNNINKCNLHKKYLACAFADTGRNTSTQKTMQTIDSGRSMLDSVKEYNQKANRNE